MRLQKKTALIILLIFILFLLIFLIRVKNDMDDFEVNYKAGKRLKLAETLYRFEDRHYMFKYLPSCAYLYLPLSFLPLDLAKGIWYFFIIFCTAALIRISYELVPSSKEKSKCLMVIPPLILTKYFLRELDLGQINTLVTLVLLLMLWLLQKSEKEKPRKKDIQAGLLWGLAVALKPYALIFFPYFVIKREWKSLISGVCFSGIAVLSPSLYYGLEGNFIVLKEWYGTLSQSTPTLFVTWDNISIIGFFTKWLGDAKISFILYIIALSLFAILVLLLIHFGKNLERAPVLESAVLIGLIPLVSPLGWDYTLLMFILGIMIILNYFSSYPKFWQGFLALNLGIILFSVYDIIGKNLYSIFTLKSVATINFLILIGYLAYLRFKKIC